MSDARFEDAAETPLHLKARESDDLQVIATLVQDAVLPTTDLRWQAGKRRLSLLLNRFRWEDRENADARGRRYERVRSLLVIDEVIGVASQGIDRNDPDTILSVLDIRFDAGPDGTGHVVLTLAGDGAIRAAVEALEVTLKDVTRPYLAPSGKAPHHPD